MPPGARRPRSRKAVTDGLTLVLRLFLEVRRAAATCKAATGTTPWPPSKMQTVRVPRPWPRPGKAAMCAAHRPPCLMKWTPSAPAGRPPFSGKFVF